MLPVQVEQHEAARVLGLGGAQQAPDRGVGEVGQALTVRGGDSASGEYDEPGGGEMVAREPFLKDRQNTHGGFACGGRDVRRLGTGGTGAGDQDGVRHRRTGRHGLGEGGEVGMRAEPEVVGQPDVVGAEQDPASGG